MFWFKKKVFLIEWCYGCEDTIQYTEFIKARNWYDAWGKVRKQHALPIICKKIKEVANYEQIF